MFTTSKHWLLPGTKAGIVHSIIGLTAQSSVTGNNNFLILQCNIMLRVNNELSVCIHLLNFHIIRIISLDQHQQHQSVYRQSKGASLAAFLKGINFEHLVEIRPVFNQSSIYFQRRS